MTPRPTQPPTPADEGLDDVVGAWGVEHVVPAIAEGAATQPPPGVRSAVLAHAGRSPRGPLDPVDPRQLYASRVVAMEALLADLPAEAWRATAAPYGWSVHGLIAHLLVIERYTAVQFGLDVDPPGTETFGSAPGPGHLEIGTAEIEAQLRRPPQETVRAWAAAAHRIVTHGSTPAYAPDAPAPLHGWPFSRSSALVARAFEIWTHMDDVSRATGRAMIVPPADELRTMSAFAVGALPFLLGVERPGRELGATRIVLTGPGGGTFDLGPVGGERAALLGADVVDFCRVVARRIPVADLVSTRDGDLGLLDDLLTAAGAFAV